MDSVKSGYAAIGPLRMYYEIHGMGGIPLVLIHGGGSTIRTTFGRVLPLLSKDREVIAVELQAHGHTRDIDRPLSFEQDADDVVALLQQLKVTKADIFGFSNGGQTAMQIGIRHPGIVHKLVIASASYQREGMLPGFFEGMQHATLDNMPPCLKEAYLKEDPSQDHLQAMFERDKARMLQFKDWSDETLRLIKAPSLLLFGDKDVVTLDHAVKMSRLIPNARLMVLPGTHGSYIGEVCTDTPDSDVPDRTVAAILEFLDK